MRPISRLALLAALMPLMFSGAHGQDASPATTVYETPVGKFTDLGRNDRGYRELRREKDGAVMVVVPAGWFTKRVYIGDPAVEADSFSLHTEAFLIDKYEVTNTQVSGYLDSLKSLVVKDDRLLDGKTPLARSHDWGLKIADGKFSVQQGFEKHPSVGATGELALRYARWIGGDLPYGYEWEKAAAGPSGLLFPWGDAPADSTRANSFLHGPRHTMPVGSYPAGVSPYGVHDMAGNVYDRCYWFETPEDIKPDAVPRMIRGGSWVSPHWANLRCIDRCAQPMDAAEGSVGFRCLIRDPAVLKAVGEGSRPVLRIHDDVDTAFKEAAARNVPIFLFLSYETCGQCDRTRAQVFTDKRFIEYMNEHAVVLAGQDPGDGRDDPVEPAEGPSLLYPGCRAEKLQATFDYFCRAVNVKVVPKRISEFRISPGQFALNPHLELHEEPDDMILIAEEHLRKSGDDPMGIIEQLKNAQALLGEGQSRDDFLAGKPAPKTTWQHVDAE